MKIVLIGKNGQLGWELQHTLPVLGEVISLGRAELDIADRQAIQTVLRDLKPDLIVNASAYTEVDRAEAESDLAMLINAQAPAVMAEMAYKLKTVLIHYSTDYVFDGKSDTPYMEGDQTNPLNIYGKSKLIGEQNIQQVGGAYLILRTSWVYSLRGSGFVNKVLAWSRKNKVLKIVDDQVSCPTWARSLAETTTNTLVSHKGDLLNVIQELRGIYHLAGDGYTSRYEWAKAILALDPNPTEQLVQSIEPVSSAEFPTPALRPSFTALNCTKFEKKIGLRMSGWEETLQLAITE